MPGTPACVTSCIGHLVVHVAGRFNNSFLLKLVCLFYSQVLESRVHLEQGHDSAYPAVLPRLACQFSYGIRAHVYSGREFSILESSHWSILQVLTDPVQLVSLTDCVEMTILLECSPNAVRPPGR